ncbi:MAG: hypothetical protein B7Z37_23535 [Verrucomicrobia bacterium 12-59-8]|nr:MAG: hypothetical protein B7Z37_23535 [Verrucomicrobia bacterium 12-59-8]
MSKDNQSEILSIDSPIHQIRAIEEAVLDTGAAIVVPVGIEEFADAVLGASREEIISIIEGMNTLPEMIMNGRDLDAPPVVALIVFIDQSLANLLDPVQKDKTEEEQDEE